MYLGVWSIKKALFLSWGWPSLDDWTVSPVSYLSLGPLHEDDTRLRAVRCHKGYFTRMLCPPSDGSPVFRSPRHSGWVKKSSWSQRQLPCPRPCSVYGCALNVWLPERCVRARPRTPGKYVTIKWKKHTLGPVNAPSPHLPPQPILLYHHHLRQPFVTQRAPQMPITASPGEDYGKS